MDVNAFVLDCGTGRESWATPLTLRDRREPGSAAFVRKERGPSHHPLRAIGPSSCVSDPRPSRDGFSRGANFEAAVIRSCSGPCTRSASRLHPPQDRTAIPGGQALYTTQNSVGYLPRAVASLRTRCRAIGTAGLSPAGCGCSEKACTLATRWRAAPAGGTRPIQRRIAVATSPGAGGPSASSESGPPVPTRTRRPIRDGATSAASTVASIPIGPPYDQPTTVTSSSPSFPISERSSRAFASIVKAAGAAPGRPSERP